MNKFEFAAEKLVSLTKPRKGERFCLITDGAVPKAFKSLESVCKRLGIEFEVARIRSRRASSSPIPEAKTAIKRGDVLIALTGNSVTHSPEVSEAKKNGKRGISMPRVTEKMFLGVRGADASGIARTNAKIVRVLTNAKTVFITSKNGTRLLLGLGKRKIIDNNSDFSISGKISNVPFGEVYTAPLETKANGRIVVDAWNQIRRKDKAVLEVKNGKIVSWSKGAAPLIKELKKGGEKGLVIAEFALGTNPAHKKPIGNVLFDEKIYGSVHIAFGNNYSFGGKNKAGVHEDVVILAPQVYLNGNLFSW